MQGLVVGEAEKKTPRECGAFNGFVRRSKAALQVDTQRSESLPFGANPEAPGDR